MPRIKYCFMKTCKNNTSLSPGKQFFTVPEDNKAEWCAAAGLDHVPTRGLFICEDHLDLEEDMENFLYWKTMKVKARLKPRLPIFKQPLQDVTNILGLRISTDMSQCTETIASTSRSVGVLCRPQTTNRQTQAKPRMADRTTNCSLKTTVKKHIYEEALQEQQAPSAEGSTASTDITDVGSSSETIIPEERPILSGQKFLISLVEKKPMSYIGISKQCYWIVAYLACTTPITILGILITLFKVRNNDTFARISDLFEISRTTTYRTYYQTLCVLSKFLTQFVYWPSAYDIKRNLPDAFKVHKEYAQVQAIIDCFECQIEKPSNPVEQSLTWSQYKSCNTVKYLISSTPNGFINFISKGYGGRISDVNLVEQCGFLENVPANCTILADRGFKHLETILHQKGIKLLRPPSVFKNQRQSKLEVLQTKIIASLRVHIERVIRRIRLFKLLKPHATVHNKLINTLDDVAVVACGLINLQSSIIKRN